MPVFVKLKYEVPFQYKKTHRPFQNLTIDRIIIHEVFRRSEARDFGVPSYDTHLIQINRDARDVLQLRIFIEELKAVLRSRALRFTARGTDLAASF